jgi:purine-binding chemotaxis protein CheW
MNSSDPTNGQERGFDWDSVRQRIAAVNAALEKTDEIPQEVLEEIWARRAAELAKVPAEEDETEQTKLVLVRLGREIYGFDARNIFSIKPAELITYVPRVPDWVTGVVNLRGRILSVVNLRRFFRLPPAEGNGENDSDSAEGMAYMVVVETPTMEVALLVDDVLTVDTLLTSQMQDVTGTVRGLRPEYVRGVVTRTDEEAEGNGTMVVVLDLPALLADERLIVREEIV